MKNVEFATLRLFVAVAECGSLSLASERMHLVVAAISRRMSDLEAQVGTPLFQRHSRGVRLTMAGAAMLRHAKAILADFERMEDEANDFSTGVQGRIRLAANTSAVTQFLPLELASFLRDHPQVRVSLKEQTSRKVVEAIRSGATDLGIFMCDEPHAGIVALDYQTDRLCVVARADHPVLSGGRVRFSEALHHDFVGLRRTSSLTRLLRRHAGEQMRLTVEVRSFDAMCRMVQAGLGIGILPEQSAEPHMASMGLEAVILDEPWAERRFLIGMRVVEGLSAACRNLLRHLTTARRAVCD